MNPVNRLYTPGPVPIEEHILSIGSTQAPYNRTAEFSQVTRDILSGLGYVFQTDGEVAILTGSGTLAMEAVALNFLTSTDKVLIVNGGTFGQRWCDLCKIYSIPFREINLEAGVDLDLPRLRETCEEEGFSALLINAHETSTGQLYDIEAVGKVAREFGLFYVVDAISTICADPFQMDDWDVDVAVLSSQKALALPPGLSFVAMGARAIDRLAASSPKTLYMNLQDYLRNQERGQLPYTPAIGLLLQLHQRLLDIQQRSLSEIISQHLQRALDFRRSMIDFPLSILPERQSNAMTALLCDDMDAQQVVRDLRTRHGIEVAPSGGALQHKLIRISHMGDQNSSDIDYIVASLAEMFIPNSAERVL